MPTPESQPSPGVLFDIDTLPQHSLTAGFEALAAEKYRIRQTTEYDRMLEDPRTEVTYALDHPAVAASKEDIALLCLQQRNNSRVDSAGNRLRRRSLSSNDLRSATEYFGVNPVEANWETVLAAARRRALYMYILSHTVDPRTGDPIRTISAARVECMTPRIKRVLSKLLRNTTIGPYKNVDVNAPNAA